ncbi:MAG: protein disulfide oxidoreductase [Woeseiaceae bacterium]
MMKFNNKGYRWLFDITLIIIVIFGVKMWMQRNVVSGIAPNFNAKLLNGEPYKLYADTKRPILIHFWATWCPVCQLEQSNIENISKSHPVITIAMKSGNNNELKHFIKEEGVSFQVINDEDASLSNLYKIKGVPVSLIVNKENKIEFIEVGYTTEIGLRLRLWWAGL